MRLIEVLLYYSLLSTLIETPLIDILIEAKKITVYKYLLQIVFTISTKTSRTVKVTGLNDDNVYPHTVG